MRNRHHKKIVWVSKIFWIILREIQCKGDGHIILNSDIIPDV